MFHLNSNRVYRAATLEPLNGIEHGFGTRASQNWPQEPLAWVRQIHSDRIVVATAGGCLGEADAILTRAPGLWVGIRTADCIPILIADPIRRAVAAVHAGWRGTAQCIAAKAVLAMQREFGTEPGDVVAAIGPGVCGRCYEVGPEVGAQFKAQFPERNDLDARALIDLAEANRRLLISAGVPERQIATNAPCTLERPGEFHSWRRDHVKTGRMVSAIRVRE